MSNPRLIGIGIALSLGASVALACGPDFPWQLLDNRQATLAATPSNSFAYEAAHLVPATKDSLKAVELSEFQREQATALFAQAQAEGLTTEQAAQLAEMRAAETGEAAFAKGAIVPAAVRLYTAGAVDFIMADDAKAAERFQAVLELPADDQRARSVWAAFMLGRLHKRAGEADKAAEAFALTRTLALKGAPDPLGLAVASYGEEARLHLDRATAVLGDDGALPTEPDAIATYGRETAAAAALYAEQAARGSDIGVQSLRIIAEQLLEKPERISATVADPLVQRLLVAYVLARESDLPQQSVQADPNAPKTAPAPNPLLVMLVEAVERSGLDHPAGADRLAALAYRTGRYDLAATLAAKTASPLASWVKAKLALQRGDLAAAAGFLCRGVERVPEPRCGALARRCERAAADRRKRRGRAGARRVHRRARQALSRRQHLLGRRRLYRRARADRGRAEALRRCQGAAAGRPTSRGAGRCRRDHRRRLENQTRDHEQPCRPAPGPPGAPARPCRAL
jgi:cellulose synthase operon protein C